MTTGESKEKSGWQMPEGMTCYYMALLKKGPTWTPEETPELIRLQQAHLDNNRRLLAEHKSLALGPFPDNGFIRGINIFKTQSETEARAWANTDPMSQSKRLDYELHPWLVAQDAFNDIDQPRLTDEEWQRKSAAALFNQTWELIDKPDRTPEDDLEMIHLAHASRAMWKMIGEAENLDRGEWQIAHVYTILNRAEPALYHAKRCLEICEANHIGDFDLAFAYEAMARASACAGDRSAAHEYYRLAEQAGEKIAEQDDKEIFGKSLGQEPWFGLT